MAKKLMALSGKKRAAELKAMTGVKPTEEQAQSLAAVSEEKAMVVLVKHWIDTVTNTGWTTGGHTAVDVPVLALGVGSEQFAGFQDNTEIATKLMALLPKQ